MGPTIFLGFALLAQSITPINVLNPQVRAVNCKAYAKLVDSYLISKANVLADQIQHLTYYQFVKLKEVEEYLKEPHLCQSVVLDNWGVK